MSRTLAEIRAAGAGQLAAVTTATQLRVDDSWPGTINPPALVITRRSTAVTEFNGGSTTVLAFTVYLQSSDPETAQDALDAYLSPSGSASIRAALEVDTTWGGVVRSVVFDLPVEEEGLVEYPAGSNTQYLSASVPCTVVHE